MRGRGRRAAVAAAVAVSLMLSGCSVIENIYPKDDWSEWTPTGTSLTVHEDGTLTETIVDSLDESYYDTSELQTMAQEAVAAYDQENGASAVTLTSFEAQSYVVTLVLDYATVQDCADFNNTVCFDGSMLEAEMAGYRFEAQFMKVKGSTVTEENLDRDEPLSHKELRVMISDGEHTVFVPGQIVYVSQGAELINSHTAAPGRNVTVSEPEEETEAGLVLPSNAVYRKGTEMSEADEEEEEKLFYIIYEG